MGAGAGLSPEAMEIVRLRKVSGRRRLKEWLPLLEEMAVFDQRTNASLKVLGGLSVLSGVLLVISGIASFIALASDETGVAGVVFVIGLVLLAAFIALRMRVGSLKAIDLQDELREAVLPTLRALEEDIPPKGKITIDMNLGPTVARENMVSRNNLPTHYIKLVETVYRQRCGTLSIPLCTGGELSFCIEKDNIEYDRHYRSRSGKYKTKRKWRSVTTVEASFMPDSGDLTFDSAALSKLSDAGKVKQREKQGREQCRLVKRMKAKSQGSPPDDTVSAGVLIAMSMHLCGATTPTAGKEQANA